MQNVLWFVVVNPRSGGGKAAEDWPEISGYLTKAGLIYETAFTQYQGHAMKLVEDSVNRGSRHIIAVGGDGTANEIINGIFNQNVVSTSSVTVALIPVGTGNDWGRTVGIPSMYQDAISAIISGKTLLQDVGLVRFYQDNIVKERYFINVAGMGYDATVAEKTNRLKEKGRRSPVWYLFSLLMCLLKYKNTRVKIAVDSEIMEGEIFSLSVGIGKYNGGGMMQLPMAVPDDGLYDVTVIGKMGKLDVIRNVFNLYNGSFINHPKVTLLRGTKVTISSEPRIHLEVDGELVGHSRFDYEIIHGGLNVIVK